MARTSLASHVAKTLGGLALRHSPSCYHLFVEFTKTLASFLDAMFYSVSILFETAFLRFCSMWWF